MTSPLLTNLVSHWKFNEPAGTAYLTDVLGNNTATGGGSTEAGSTTGKVGACRTFVGTEVYSGGVNSTNNLAGKSFALAGWVYPDDDGGINALVAKGGTENPEFNLYLYRGLFAGLNPRFQVQSTYVTHPTQLFAGQWYFIACYYNHNTGEIGISLNGGSFTTASATSTISTNDGLVFAQFTDELTNIYQLNGKMDSWSFWVNRTIDLTDVTTLWNSGDGLDYPFDTGPIDILPPEVRADRLLRTASQFLPWSDGSYLQRRPRLPQEYIPTPPPTRQKSQRVEPQPEFNDVWYRQVRRWPLPTGSTPSPPAAVRAPQRNDPPPEFNDVWYRQVRRWPLPTQYVPVYDDPPLKQRTQRVDPPEVIDHLWYQQRRLHPVPTGVVTAHAGLYGIYLLVLETRQGGVFGVRNDIAGYNVYVGDGGPPDFDAAPTAFTQTLPVSVPLTPPVSGYKTYFVVVRAQNQYGLESQNQYAKRITIDSGGVLVYPPLLGAEGLQLSTLPGWYIKILSTYPGWYVDEYLASHWYIWVGTSPPDVMAPPTATVTLTGNILTTSVGPFLPDTTYHVAVALYRTAGNSTSPELRGTVTFPPVPVDIDPVRSGYEDP